MIRHRSGSLDEVSSSRPSKQAKTADSEPEERPLCELLDVSEVPAEDLLARFDLIAHTLLCQSRLRLVSGDKVELYEVLEAEFYLLDREKHFDPFTHGEEEQKVSGRWYFHRAPRRSAAERDSPPTGYRGGTRKGVDLTFGGPLSPSAASTKGPRGGILLRTLKKVSGNNRIISGPSLLVDEILAASNASGIKELVEDLWNGDSNAFRSTSEDKPGPSLSVIEHIRDAGQIVPTMYTSPRIGLDLSNPSDSDARIRMVGRSYRYFTNPRLLVANGRTQTFAGLYRSLKAGSKPPHLYLASKVAGLSGLSENVCSKYLASYKSGMKMKASSFVGPKGKGVCGSPDKYLAMLGSLESDTS